MKIGIDIDDTITETAKSIFKYRKKFIKEESISVNEKWLLEKNDFRKFMNHYGKQIYSLMKLKKNAKKVITELYNDGYEIYFITARDNRDVPNIETYTKEYLAKEEIPYHKLICKAKNKALASKKYHLNLMIDDQETFLDSFTSNDIIKLRMVKDKSIYSKYRKVTNWKEINQIIKAELR